MRALYTLTIFLSSALLFLVQPMAAKTILPTFGGSPQVWSAALVFFQGVLLVGYLYAHVSTQRLKTRRQSLVHVGLFLVAALALPFSTLTGAFQSVQQRAGFSDLPALYVFLALAALVGVPFLVVSAGAPILQRWFADTNDPAATDPYFLYAASNAGSFVGLFAYPFVLEPRFDLKQQAMIWAGGYAVLFVLMALCAVALRRSSPHVEAAPVAEEPVRPVVSPWLWIILAAVPTSLLTGVTQYLTTNIAPMPLLWVVPLAMYLVTFILAFAKWGEKPVPILGRLLPLLVTPVALVIVLETTSPILPLGLMHLSVFFVAAWMCHARLASLRPAAKDLTRFYFYLALGGVLGGAFNALLAPAVFPGLWEYPIALAVACMLRPMRREFAPKGDLLYPVLVAVLTFASTTIALQANMAQGMPRTLMIAGLPVLLAFLAADMPIRNGLALLGVFFTSFLMYASSDGRVLASDRSFFGVHRVARSEFGRFHRLVHGNTLHGMQDTLNPGRALTYYHRTGPIGQLMEAVQRTNDTRPVALVGLGVGSLAAYGIPGQKMTFYEIDPHIEAIARNDRLFTYLKDSRATINVVIGDARLRLAASPDKYQLIVLDAFSSDAIPVHLLTREAIEMYLTKVTPDGVLAFHISNRYLALEDVLGTTATQLGLVGAIQDDAATDSEQDEGKTASKWIIFARDLKGIERLTTKFDWTAFEPTAGVRPWTDAFSNLLDTWRPD